MRRMLLGIVSAAALLTGVLVAPSQAEPPGTLAVEPAAVSVGDDLVFTYAFPEADPTNWIGIYRDPGDGPVAEEYVGPSLDWQYVDAASGTATFDTSAYEAGDYRAFALARDGYAWLAAPVSFTVVDDQPLHFVTERVPLRNARAATAYRASLTGLVEGAQDGLAFDLVRGPSWLRVAADGTVTGTPAPRDGGAATAQVQVTNAAGELDTATVEIDVRRRGQQLVPQVRVMSWNLWHGGSQVSDHREKQLRFVLDQDVDVIGIQEGSQESATELADRLGWDSYQAGDDLGIVSRYPIVRRGALPSESGMPANDVVVRLDPARRTDLAVWNVHLGYTPYGPYDACFGQMSVPGLLAREAESGRTAQIQSIVHAMRPQLRRSQDTQVVLTGDFNAPSHLDWTRRAARCGYGDVPWPTSTVPTQAGLVDTYRRVHRDPVAVPGTTWSPIYETFTGGYGHDEHTGEPEPQDRIDFVYAAGDWRVLDSTTLVAGDPSPIPDHADNEWTSDHAAVLTELRVR